MTDDGGEPIKPIMPDSDVGRAKDEEADAQPQNYTVSEHSLEMPDPEPGTDTHLRFEFPGADEVALPDDGEDDQPIDSPVPGTSSGVTTAAISSAKILSQVKENCTRDYRDHKNAQLWSRLWGRSTKGVVHIIAVASVKKKPPSPCQSRPLFSTRPRPRKARTA